MNWRPEGIHIIKIQTTRSIEMKPFESNLMYISEDIVEQLLFCLQKWIMNIALGLALRYDNKI